MTIIVNTQKEKITQLEKEQLHLINKIRELNEQKANFMNAEVDRQAAWVFVSFFGYFWEF